MPEAVEECVKSVLDENPDYSESRAYAICNAMQNKGQLGEYDTHDELLRAYADAELEDCPSGHVKIDGKCVPVEEVDDIPPSAFQNSEARVFQLSELSGTEPIERVEQSDGSVRYRNIKLLSPGVWTDSGSRETIWYSPDGIRNLEVRNDNTVNVMHDVDNDVAAVGEIDPQSVGTDADGNLYGDVVLHMDNPASEFADENLQQALDSGGAKGFGGPSVEIDAEGQEVEFNRRRGMHELTAGYLSGAAFVANPASKPVDFARQTAERSVALSSQESMVYERQPAGMSQSISKEALLEQFNLSDDIELEDDVAVQDIMGLVADALGQDVADVMDALGPMMDGDGEEMAEHGDKEDEDEEDEEEMEMQAPEELMERIAALEERLESVEDEHAQIMNEMVAESDLSDELEEAREELADAETVQELANAKEELDKRLSELENEPKEPKSLADVEDGDEIDLDTVDSAGTWDRTSRSFGR